MKKMEDNVESGDMGAFVYSQKGKRLLAVGEYLYQLTKTYTQKTSGNTVLYWNCERWRDLGCSVTVRTDSDGTIVKGPSTDHCHNFNRGRVTSLAVRHDLLTETPRVVQRPRQQRSSTSSSPRRWR